MKFSVNTSDFQKAINSVEGVITAREIKSSLSNIKIEAIKDKVFLSATDLEISIKTHIEAEIKQEGAISLPARQLSSAFKTINFKETQIEVDEETGHRTFITDKTGTVDFKFDINGMEIEEIQTIPEIPAKYISDFSCFEFAKMIKKTSYSIAIEDTRFVFNGLYITSKDKELIFVATDGRRLSRIKKNIGLKMPFEKGVIVPHKAIKEISKMIESTEAGKIGLYENQIYLAIDKTEILCKLIDGAYPDYQAVIPKSSSNMVTLPKEQLQIAVKQALIAAEEPSRQIRLGFSQNNLNVNASTPGATEMNINIPVEYDSEEIQLGFKGEYLSDIMKVIEDDLIEIEFSSSGAPAVFKDPADQDFLSVIMPMKL